MVGCWCSSRILLTEEIEVSSELAASTPWLPVWGSSDGTTEGLRFLTLVYAENQVTICLGQRNSKGGECGVRRGKSKGSGCKARSLLGGGWPRKWPGHVAGGGGMVLGCPVKGTKWLLGLDF